VVEIFVEKITRGGIFSLQEDDAEVEGVAEAATNQP
jgi:hypothetical protein